MSETRVWMLRIFGLLTAAWVIAVSIRFAVADNYAHPAAERTDAVERLDKAIGMRPTSAEYLLWKARTEMAGMTANDATLRNDFEKVLALDSRNPEALMNLGALAQRAGNSAKAEAYLLQAVELDHTFKPVWTLTNHYFQTGEFSKMWPQVTQSLNIADPGLAGLAQFSAEPIFELCWQAGATPQQILALTPQRPGLLTGFFLNALGRQNLDAAMLVFEKTLAVSAPTDTVGRNAFAGLCWKLLGAHRTREAVGVWNRLVERGMVKGTTLDPGKGISLTDAEFREGPALDPFSWMTKANPHIALTSGRGWLRVEFDGREDEQLELLTKNLPVLPGRSYAFRWKAALEGEKKAMGGESGLAMVFFSGDNALPERCPDLLGAGNMQECMFRTPPDSDLVRMAVLYRRPLGSRRFVGTVQVTGFEMELVRQ